MLIPSIKRTSPDVIYTVVKNVDVADAVDGDCLIWDQTVAVTTNYGVDVKFSTAAGGDKGVAGIASGAIVAGDYGLAQIFGYHPHVKADVGATVGLSVKTFTVVKTVGAGAAADEPVQQIGVVLKAVAAGFAGVMLRIM